MRAKAAYRGASDSMGSFRFEEVKPGNYSIDFSKGCFSVSRAIRLEAHLGPFGKISGRVLDPNGEPVADAKLLLNGQQARATATSDSRGQFSFQPAPGCYIFDGEASRGVVSAARRW